MHRYKFVYLMFQFNAYYFNFLKISFFLAYETFLVVSVATEETDGYLRFIRSLKKYSYDYEVKINIFVIFILNIFL